jgi:hypothetical protein
MRASQGVDTPATNSLEALRLAQARTLARRAHSRLCEWARSGNVSVPRSFAIGRRADGCTGRDRSIPFQASFEISASAASRY